MDSKHIDNTNKETTDDKDACGGLSSIQQKLLEKAQHIIEFSKNAHELHPLGYSDSLFFNDPGYRHNRRVRILSTAVKRTKLVSKTTHKVVLQNNAFLHTKDRLACCGKGNKEFTECLYAEDGDYFKGVWISCAYPEQISTVELFFREHTSDADDASDYNRDVEYVSVKRVYYSKSSYIQFFDFPLALTKGVTWKIGIWMDSSFGGGVNPIRLEFLSVATNNLSDDYY